MAAVYVSDHEERLLSEEKLVLILDLDRTLIDTTTNPDPSSSILQRNGQVRLDVSLIEFAEDENGWFIKKRPGVDNFLENMSQIFELHMCTYASRDYADGVMEIVDPGRRLIKKLYNRDHCINRKKTHIAHQTFVSGNLNLIAIIDDLPLRMWEDLPNVVRVKPYKYFRKCKDHMQEQELAMGRRPEVWIHPLYKFQDEDDEPMPVDNRRTTMGPKNLTPYKDTDAILEHVEKVLCALHTRFFQLLTENPSHLPHFGDLNKQLGRILQGANIFFESNCRKEKNLTQLARTLGADIHDTFTGKHRSDPAVGSPGVRYTTHVVSKNYYARIKRPYNPHVHYVSPNFIYACFKQWKRMDEKIFMLKPCCLHRVQECMMNLFGIPWDHSNLQLD